MADGCDFEFMEYIDEQSIDPNLICSICQKALKDPVSTPCDHTYGRGCITRWLQESENRSCPICNESPLAVTQLIQASRPLRNMLDQFRVRCTLCTQTDLRRDNFTDHINKVCPKAIVQCKATDIKCPWQGTRDELPNHMTTCVFEPLRPVLSSLIDENKQLNDRVQKHDEEIKKLMKIISQLQNMPANETDDQSDASSVSEFAVDDNQAIEEDTIFITNLPATIKFNDLFDTFSKIGRIKFNENSKKSNIFIFKNQRNQNGPCSAKVGFISKESAAAAIAAYHGKHVPQWNTVLKVNLSRKSKHLRDHSKSHYTKVNPQNAQCKAAENLEHVLNKNQKCSDNVAQEEPKSASSQAKPKKNKSVEGACGTTKPTN